MAQEKFSAAVSTLSGSSFSNFLKSSAGIKVDPQYRLRYITSALVSLCSEPFRWVENWKYGKAIRNKQLHDEPVFIIGHWRSGTTYLHNLMSKDPQMGYVSTYQGIFPHQVLSGNWLYKSLMVANMPNKRPADGVELSADYPQEEEFAIGNTNPNSFYHFWFFPKHMKEFFHRSILQEGMTKAEKEKWKADYLTLVKKAMINVGGERFISKNPPHTGRIDLLLEMFPNARFIHIYRNPVVVFKSTVNFFTKTIVPLEFQHISKEEMEENILYIYERLMNRYEELKKQIPEGHLIELKYEDFEQDPLTHMQQIYETLGISGFEKARQPFEAYIASQQKFKSSKHSITNDKLDEVINRWGFAMEHYGYEMPQDIRVEQAV